MSVDIIKIKLPPQKIQIVPVFFVDDALLSVKTENE